jgi:hypothetical protein
MPCNKRTALVVTLACMASGFLVDSFFAGLKWEQRAQAWPGSEPGAPGNETLGQGDAVLTDDSLGQLLTSLFPTNKPLGKNGAGRSIYQFSVQYKDMTYWMKAMLSGDQSNVWLIMSLQGLPNTEATGGAPIARLLEESMNWGPSHFCIESGGLQMRRATRNRGVNNDFLKAEINYVAEAASNTDQVWYTPNWPAAGLVRRFTHHQDYTWDAVFLPDNLRGLSASSDRTLKVFNLTDGTVLSTLTAPGGILSAAVSKDGKHALSGGVDGVIRYSIVADGKIERELKGHMQLVWAVALSPDGRWAASAGGSSTDDSGKPAVNPDFSIRLWNLDSGKEERHLDGHTDRVTQLAFTPDSARLVSGSDDQSMRLWEVQTGKIVQQMDHGQQIYGVAVSPDGKKALSACNDKLVHLWNLDSGNEIRRFQGHSDSVWCVAYSPDGTRALSGGYDRSMRLWDVETGEQLKVFGAHTAPVMRVSFGPDGRRALSTSQDDNVRIWSLAK